MFNQIVNKVYPFFSLGFIEVGEILRTSQTILDAFVLLLQILIGVLTILKIYSDIKKNVFKSVEKSEKDTEKKHLFLSSLIKYLTKK